MGEGQTPGVSHAKGPEESRPARVTPELVREELERVLASHEFRSSKRSQEFLRYVIENTLSGHGDLLKERTIGIDVFGRSADYDPSDDATVRVKAGEVRKRLGLYYSSEGAQDPLRIEMPFGTYVPEFRPAPAGAVAVAPASAHPVPAPALAAPMTRSVMLRWMLAAALLVAVAAVAFSWFGRGGNPTLDQFWAPVLNDKSPVLICAAFVPVWNLNRDPNLTVAPRPEDFVLLTDQFVGGGDLIATSRLVAMLTRMERPYRVRVGNTVTFQDLRGAPAIFVGYSLTRWREISNQMRFFIDASRLPVVITDNGAPTKWMLPNLPPDRRTTEDYALLTRVFHPDTHAMLVEISGITQYGTDAAGELVTNPDLLREALHGAPPGWQKKNLQLVLHVKVISGVPASPTVVASHFW
ncbi:MAG: hypothetical protein ABSH46_09905 [Bryobacteraceae bacterium]|jgi:hypothetical protein